MRIFCSLLVLALAACHPSAQITLNSVDSRSGLQCTSLCGQVGMTLDSLVIMGTRVGCVCRATPPVSTPPAAPTGPEQAPPPAPAPTTSSRAAAATGVATFLLDEQDEETKTNNGH